MTTSELKGREEVLGNYQYNPITLRISNPGKFEGEPIFAPYYWGLALEGFSDSDNGQVFSFRFSNKGKDGCNDFETWPELKKWLGRKRSLKLYEDSQGFVHCV